jgi:hypothetical protein
MAGLVIETSTPGSTAPLLSIARPVITPVNAWPDAVGGE